MRNMSFPLVHKSTFTTIYWILKEYMCCLIPMQYLLGYKYFFLKFCIGSLWIMYPTKNLIHLPLPHLPLPSYPSHPCNPPHNKEKKSCCGSCSVCVSVCPVPTLPWLQMFITKTFSLVQGLWLLLHYQYWILTEPPLRDPDVAPCHGICRTGPFMHSSSSLMR
jgi:ferredoxin